MALPHSPEDSALQAISSAYNDEEQAVLIVTLLAISAALTTRENAANVITIPWPLQIEDIADTVGEDSTINTNGGVGVSEIGFLDCHLLEVISKTTNEASYFLSS